MRRICWQRDSAQASDGDDLGGEMSYAERVTIAVNLALSVIASVVLIVIGMPIKAAIFVGIFGFFGVCRMTVAVGECYLREEKR